MTDKCSQSSKSSGDKFLTPRTSARSTVSLDTHLIRRLLHFRMKGPAGRQTFGGEPRRRRATFTHVSLTVYSSLRTGVTFFFFNACYARRARDSPAFPREKRETGPLSTADIAATHGNGLGRCDGEQRDMGTPAASFRFESWWRPSRPTSRRHRTHACMQIALSVRGPWTPKTPGSQWHFLRLPPRREGRPPERSNRGNSPAVLVLLGT